VTDQPTNIMAFDVESGNALRVDGVSGHVCRLYDEFSEETDDLNDAVGGVVHWDDETVSPFFFSQLEPITVH
jgi:hypothetical protein